MIPLFPLLGVVGALGLAAGEVVPEPRAAHGACIDDAPCLEVPLRLDPGGGAVALPRGPRRERAVPPPCVADVCQARVDVPGFGPAFGKAHKSELFVALLDRARLEPFASIAWTFVVTGLRVDWTPANLDAGLGATRGGWGNVFVRLRLRIDALNRVVIPERSRVPATRFGTLLTSSPARKAGDSG